MKGSDDRPHPVCEPTQWIYCAVALRMAFRCAYIYRSISSHLYLNCLLMDKHPCLHVFCRWICWGLPLFVLSSRCVNWDSFMDVHGFTSIYWNFHHLNSFWLTFRVKIESKEACPAIRANLMLEVYSHHITLALMKTDWPDQANQPAWVGWIGSKTENLTGCLSHWQKLNWLPLAEREN